MEFTAELSTRVEYVNEIILRMLPIQEEAMTSPLFEAMSYSVKNGGKRIRPILMHEVFYLFSKSRSNNALRNFMTAIEFIHTYSLIHDDLPAMDNDELRRGMPTCHIAYGENIAILAGDGLLNYASELMLKACLSTEPKMTQFTLQAAYEVMQNAGIYGMIGGQAADVLSEGKTLTEEQLMYIHMNKTAKLITTATVAGALLAGADEMYVDKMREMGIKLGIAFQIKDDLLDLESTNEVLGKPVGSDERNNKSTIITVLGRKRAKEMLEELIAGCLEILNYFDAEQTEFLKDLVLYTKTRKN